ncbi:helix-turn-helix domain-containing protein [Actinocorallia sp. API 0066]|uniref:PucR family transcriptional regulator n=1 Tax=Actinocorallia sp. API 0066 TaxID=2896846 RepID=UPI001E5DCF5B|nr:helix-turn-helix domain-containing protein [Actinocorallia sp. API 0066]MCD0448813.1 helix-turn-helix domain-containing protein [Actinocorallia sp. API 0066]
MGALGLIERNHTHKEVVGLAARRLADDTADLEARLLQRIRTQCPVSARLVPEAEQLESVRLGLAYGLASIPEPGPERRELLQAARTGRRRAAQGVPLDEVIKSYHLAVQLVWDELVRVIRRDAPEQLDLLMRSSMHIWAGIERQADVAADAYREAQADQARFADERARLLLGELLETPAPEQPLIDAIRDTLGLEENGSYAVAVTRYARPRRGVRQPDLMAGCRVVWSAGHDGDIAVVALRCDDLGKVAAALEAAVQGPVGLSPAVSGLASLPFARRLADTALAGRRSEERGVVALDDHLLRSFVKAAPDLAELLRRQIMTEVLALPSHESSALLDTLACWLEVGSTAEAARRLYCHRNTVLNRLRRLEQVTGRKLDEPRDVVLLALALESVKAR